MPFRCDAAAGDCLMVPQRRRPADGADGACHAACAGAASARATPLPNRRTPYVRPPLQTSRAAPASLKWASASSTRSAAQLSCGGWPHVPHPPRTEPAAWGRGTGHTRPSPPRATSLAPPGQRLPATVIPACLPPACFLPHACHLHASCRTPATCVLAARLTMSHHCCCMSCLQVPRGGDFPLTQLSRTCRNAHLLKTHFIM